MISFKEHVDLQEKMATDVVQWFKDLLPKKVKHDINRMNHKRNIKKQLNNTIF